MASVEGLKRFGNYAIGIAEKSTGVFHFREAVSREKAIKGEVDWGARMLASQEMTLAPATVRQLVWGTETGDSSDSEIKRFVKGSTLMLRFITSAGLDAASLVVPLVEAVINQDPLLLLGKPLYNAAIQVTADIWTARRFGRKSKELTKAGPETYDFLSKAYDKFYDPKLKLAVIQNSKGEKLAIIDKEEVCVESGGSCMVPVLFGEQDGKRWVEGAHISDKDIVVHTYSEKMPEASPPIGELMIKLKEIVGKVKAPAI